MKLNKEKGNELFSLPLGCRELLTDADEGDLKVLLYMGICEAEGNTFDAAKAAEELSLSENEVKSSLKFWKGAGLMKKSVSQKKPEADIEKAKSRPLIEKRTMNLTSSELCKIAEENEDFKILLDAAQQTAGWLFNTGEIEIMASLYSNLKLSAEYILALIGYYVCRREKPLRYLEKVAYAFVDEGITSAGELEERLRTLERFEGFGGMVRRLFGIGQREFTKNEKKLLSDWQDVYCYGEQIIRAAFEKTVNNTGKASIGYANSILKSWHEAGVKTEKDIEKLKNPSAKSPSKTKAGTAHSTSFDVDDAFSKALARSYSKDKK